MERLAPPIEERTKTPVSFLEHNPELQSYIAFHDASGISRAMHFEKDHQAEILFELWNTNRTNEIHDLSRDYPHLFINEGFDDQLVLVATLVATAEKQPIEVADEFIDDTYKALVTGELAYDIHLTDELYEKFAKAAVDALKKEVRENVLDYSKTLRKIPSK